MTGSIVTKLILKDLYFNRSLIVGGTLAGLLAEFLTSRIQLAGMIVFVTVVVVCAIFLGLVAVTRERSEKSAVFVLSLPVSAVQYTGAKMIAATISFLIVWAVLLAVPLFRIWLGATPSEGLPFLIGIMSLILTNFFILLTVGMITLSEKWIAGSIILTNTSVPFFFANSGGSAAESGASPSWTPGLLAGFAIEAAIIALCLGIVFYVQLKRKDFV